MNHGNLSAPVAALAFGLLTCAAASAQVVDSVFSNQFEQGAASLAPGLVYARVGAATTGIGGPLVLQLDDVAASNTFVPIVSLDPARVTVNGGGVTVLAGQSQAQVAMTPLSSSPTPVLLRASLGNQVYASVRVVDDGEARNVVAITPASISIAPGSTRSFSVQLDLPAPLGGSLVDLAVNPPLAGTLPATITVATDSFMQGFNYTDLDVAESALLSASIGAGTPAQALVTQSPIGKLVINEVDYDQPGASDTTEFIEIYNRSPDTVALSGLVVYLVNGNAMPQPAPYQQFVLAEAQVSLAPGEYLIIGQPAVTLPPGTAFIPLPGIENNIQNGAPDGIVIADTDALTVIDALSYEGSISNALLPGFPAPVDLVEGTATSAVDGAMVPGSLARLPNGTDNNNANTDFVLAATMTPGASNNLLPPGLMINEVDYDQVGAGDAASFIEILNNTGTAVALADLAVVLVNGGTNLEYARFNLAAAASTLPAGGLLVIRNATVAVPPGTPVIDVAGDFMQNGGPDAVALVNTATQTVIDALSYEGNLTAAVITGFTGTFNLVEGTATTAVDSNAITMSLARVPGGVDDNNAVSDWITTQVMTPGAVNPKSDNETTDPRELDYCILQFPAAAMAQPGMPSPMIYGRVFETGLTETGGPNGLIVGELGYGPAGSNPIESAGAWQFFPTTFNLQVGNDDEYQAQLTVPGVGIYAYTFRFSRDGGAHWTYCDLTGAGANPGADFEPGQLGTLTVAP